jgi:hypothetical protein
MDKKTSQRLMTKGIILIDYGLLICGWLETNKITILLKPEKTKERQAKLLQTEAVEE